MMTIARGLAQVISGGRPVSNMNPDMVRIAGDFAGIPIPVVILACVALAAWVILANTRIGRHIYAVGGNENAARASGINVRRVKMFAYTFCGGLVRIGGNRACRADHDRAAQRRHCL